MKYSDGFVKTLLKVTQVGFDYKYLPILFIGMELGYGCGDGVF
jgi:hypothetical protein